MLPTAGVPLIEKDASPLSTAGILEVDVWTISSTPLASLYEIVALKTLPPSEAVTL